MCWTIYEVSVRFVVEAELAHLCSIANHTGLNLKCYQQVY